MEDKNQIPSFKITLVGESGVGKTSIISRFINKEFDPDIMASIGPSYASKELEYEDLENIKIKLHVWDTAGEEKYRSVGKIFYKDSDAVILVYDSTDKRSFEELKKYWYQQLKEHSKENIVIAIAANKCDLLELEQVEVEEAKAYAKEIGAIFKLTSAFTGNGISDLFKLIGYKLLDPNYIIINEEVKTTEDNLQQARKTINERIAENKNNIVIDNQNNDNFFKSTWSYCCN